MWGRLFAVELPFCDLIFHLKALNRGIQSVSDGIDHSYSKEFTVVKKDKEEPTQVNPGKDVQPSGQLRQLTARGINTGFFGELCGGKWF